LTKIIPCASVPACGFDITLMGDDSNKGLASADEKSRERVVKKGGVARSQDKEGLSEAGRKADNIRCF
jgi:hypothetical protein